MTMHGRMNVKKKMTFFLSYFLYPVFLACSINMCFVLLPQTVKTVKCLKHRRNCSSLVKGRVQAMRYPKILDW